MSETAVLDFSSMATPTLEPQVEETPSPAPEETPPEQQPEETLAETPGTGAPEKPPEGKPPSLKVIRDAVKAFEAANPELGKHLKALLDNEGRIRAYQETYPDVDTARTVKAAIEAVGGLDGIAELSRLKDSVEETDAMIEAGDPEVVERIFSDAKEGAVKLLPHYMNRVEKENPEAFGNTLRPHLVRSLQASNFENVLAALAKATTDNPEAKEIVDSMIGWFADQRRLAEKVNLDALEPERKKLQEQTTALSQREYKQFESEVTAEVMPHIQKAFSDRMRTYLQHDTRPEAAKQDIARNWLTELGKAMEKDKKQVETLMKSRGRNKAAVANFVATRIAAVADAVTKKIVDAYKLMPGKPGVKPPAKPGEQPPPSATTAIRVTQKPSDDQIDWDKDLDRMLFISGSAYLKGSGKLVKWR